MECKRPKVRRGKYVTTMAFSVAEQRAFEEVSRRNGLAPNQVVRLALREFCQRLGIAAEFPKDLRPARSGRGSLTVVDWRDER